MALIVDPVSGTGGNYTPRRGPKEFSEAGYCGRSFNQGLIRFHDSQSAPIYQELALAAFPQIKKVDRKADVLAFDWRGNQYLTAKVRGQSGVMILHADLATAELNIITGAAEFAAALRSDNVAAFFDGDLFAAWREAAGKPDAQLAFTDCVEFTVPQFMGGEATVENLSLIDLNVAWTIGSQLISQTNSLR